MARDDYWNHATLLEAALMADSFEEAQERIGDALVALWEPWEARERAGGDVIALTAMIERLEKRAGAFDSPKHEWSIGIADGFLGGWVARIGKGRREVSGVTEAERLRFESPPLRRPRPPRVPWAIPSRPSTRSYRRRYDFRMFSRRSNPSPRTVCALLLNRPIAP